MDYFKKLLDLLKIEREEDKNAYQALTRKLSVAERRMNGLTWYPIAIKDTEMSRGDYLTVEVERPTYQDLAHSFRPGVQVVLFSNHAPAENRLEGTVSYQSGNLMKITLRTDELPDWTRDGKLGVDLLFDDNSYDEMQAALRTASSLREKPVEGRLVNILIGEKPLGQPLTNGHAPDGDLSALNKVLERAAATLNPSQMSAVDKILTMSDLAIVHGPPGTGKTTTLVQAIQALIARDHERILVVAPSNAAVDLLSERLSAAGLDVLRVGNPARISEQLMNLTLDSKLMSHPRMKEVKKLRKRASEFRDMAQKYKRNFGQAEREQRKALFDEARSIVREAEKTEQFILEELVAGAQVVTATLVGSNHYTIRNLAFGTVVIDEAGQALEPACWIPVIKAKKLVLAGDHCQLPPTVKSEKAAKEGLATTLLEKSVALHPEAVVLLEEQYRMNSLIMGYSSSVFYGDRLKAHVSVADHVLYPGDKALAFVDTAGCGYEERTEGVSTSNPEEAAFLFKHLRQLVEGLEGVAGNEGLQHDGVRNEGAKHEGAQDNGAQKDGVREDGGKGSDGRQGGFPSIAVISPYRMQIDLLKEQLEHSPTLQPYRDRISVNTIDSFQGQERDIVYISMTRSNTDSKIGFLSDIRRMNVAMTRARKKLVVIGDSATLSQSAFYADLIGYAEKHEAYQSAWEFMD